MHEHIARPDRQSHEARVDQGLYTIMMRELAAFALRNPTEPVMGLTPETTQEINGYKVFLAVHPEKMTQPRQVTSE